MKTLVSFRISPRRGNRLALRAMLIIVICSCLLLSGCKASTGSRSGNSSLGNAQHQAQNEDGQTELTAPYALLRDYMEKKYLAMGKLMELLESSSLGRNNFNLEQFRQLTTKPLYDADTGLNTALFCMSKLQLKAANDWSLQHDRYTGYLDFVGKEYRFEFYIAEEQAVQATETPEAEGTDSIVVDPLETAEEITEQPPMIPNELAGYIEGRMIDGSDRIAINVYNGREENGTRAHTLWFEFARDNEGGYWAQYYYAWDNIGVSYRTVRIHVSGDGITFGILSTTQLPGSIQALQLDENTFFSETSSVLKYDGTKAEYYEDGQVTMEFR